MKIKYKILGYIILLVAVVFVSNIKVKAVEFSLNTFNNGDIIVGKYVFPLSRVIKPQEVILAARTYESTDIYYVMKDASDQITLYEISKNILIPVDLDDFPKSLEVKRYFVEQYYDIQDEEEIEAPKPRYSWLAVDGYLNNVTHKTEFFLHIYIEFDREVFFYNSKGQILTDLSSNMFSLYSDDTKVFDFIIPGNVDDLGMDVNAFKPNYEDSALTNGHPLLYLFAKIPDDEDYEPGEGDLPYNLPYGEYRIVFNGKVKDVSGQEELTQNVMVRNAPNLDLSLDEAKINMARAYYDLDKDTLQYDIDFPLLDVAEELPESDDNEKRYKLEVINYAIFNNQRSEFLINLSEETQENYTLAGGNDEDTVYTNVTAARIGLNNVITGGGTVLEVYEAKVLLDETTGELNSYYANLNYYNTAKEDANTLLSTVADTLANYIIDGGSSSDPEYTAVEAAESALRDYVNLVRPDSSNTMEVLELANNISTQKYVLEEALDDLIVE